MLLPGDFEVWPQKLSQAGAKETGRASTDEKESCPIFSACKPWALRKFTGYSANSWMRATAQRLAFGSDWLDLSANDVGQF